MDRKGPSGRGKLAERLEVSSALSALHHRVGPNASCLHPSFNYSQSAFFGQGLPRPLPFTGQRPITAIRSALRISQSDRFGGCSGDFPPPPPAEQATASKDQTGKSGTDDGAGGAPDRR
jgi:hypothetical protein